jgi:hypothetical protein
MASRLQELREIGADVKAKEAELRQTTFDATYRHITQTLSTRPKFGKKRSPRRLQLLFYLVAAGELGFIALHGMSTVVKSFYVVSANEEHKAAKLAERNWNDHPGKHLLMQLQRSLRESSQPSDDVTILIERGGLQRIERGSATTKTLRKRSKPRSPSGSEKELPFVANDRAPQLLRHEVEQARDTDELLDLFWRPHLDTNRPTLIVCGWPLFTRSGDTFTRHVHKNFENDVARARSEGEVCWPFLSSGTALCALHLVRWLTERRVEVDWLGCRADDHLTKIADHKWRERPNVIVLGSVRSNGILASYQQESIGQRASALSRDARQTPRKVLPYQLTDDGVHKVAPSGTIIDGPWEDQLDELPYKVCSVISRREGVVEGTITMIAANYGQIIARLGEVLTNEPLFRAFIDKHQRLKNSYLKVPGSNFQVLVQMNFHDQGTVPGRYEIVRAWFDRGTHRPVRHVRSGNE